MTGGEGAAPLGAAAAAAGGFGFGGRRVQGEDVGQRAGAGAAARGRECGVAAGGRERGEAQPLPSMHVPVGAWRPPLALPEVLVQESQESGAVTWGLEHLPHLQGCGVGSSNPRRLRALAELEALEGGLAAARWQYRQQLLADCLTWQPPCAPAVSGGMEVTPASDVDAEAVFTFLWAPPLVFPARSTLTDSTPIFAKFPAAVLSVAYQQELAGWCPLLHCSHTFGTMFCLYAVLYAMRPSACC